MSLEPEGYGSKQVGSCTGFAWDGENRLTAVEPLGRPIQTGWTLVKFTYDYQGRRVEKRVFGRSSNTAWTMNPIERRRFVWGSANAGNGWLMLREMIEIDSAADGTFESTRTKTYTWGRDLSGSLETAGGIGGLLSVYDDNTTTIGGTPTADDLAYVYCYDANGNVGQLVNWAATGSGVPSGAIVAKYEYDAYGNVTASGGTYSTANTYRFSTKPWDDETGLGYWGYRYYDSRLGRWASRDPIHEVGGLCLYQFDANRPTLEIDSIGEQNGLVEPASGASECPMPGPPPPDCNKECPNACAKLKFNSGERGLVACSGDCKCACANPALEPGGPPQSAGAITQACTLAHEEVHVQQAIDNPGEHYCIWGILHT